MNRRVEETAERASDASRSRSMTTTVQKAWDMLRVIRRGGPAICNIAVTNACNARCDFCNFANGKVPFGHLRWIDADQFNRALGILHQRDVRYISFFGGEPLLHPRLPEMISMAVAKRMGPALITNGWQLPARLDQLAAAGLKTVYISIDAPDMLNHEANRGLRGLGARIRSATLRMPSLGMMPLAQVTISKLIRDYRALVPLLRELGFAAVAFSYPQRGRLGSSSLAWSEDSTLVNFTPAELIEAFDQVNDLRNAFPVNNPQVSIGGSILRVFLQVMRCRVSHDSGGRDLMAHVVGQRDCVTAHFPCASIVSGQKILVRAVTLGYAARNRAGSRFRFRITGCILGCILRKYPAKPKNDEDQTY